MNEQKIYAVEEKISNANMYTVKENTVLTPAQLDMMERQKKKPYQYWKKRMTL